VRQRHRANLAQKNLARYSATSSYFEILYWLLKHRVTEFVARQEDPLGCGVWKAASGPYQSEAGPSLFNCYEILVCSLRARDAFVNEFAAGESLICSVPVGDGWFAHFPAEQNSSAFHLAGKIQQADVDVFDLNADGIDFGKSVLSTLFGLGALGFAAGDGDYIDMRTTVEKDAMAEFLHLALDFFYQFFSVNGGAQKRFEYRKEGLSFVEGKRAV
jgi:hypothetical protein